MPAETLQPTDKDIQLVQMAFKDFDSRRFDAAEKEFSMALKTWKEIQRPRDEIVSLTVARGNCRLDNKQFDKALSDFNDAILLMNDGEKADGTANYPEYVNAFVDKGLSYEGLGDWKNALVQYNKAISLWGGTRNDNVNPFVLVYRGNVESQLGNYQYAILDYDAASEIFLKEKDIARYSDARANYALALYSANDIPNSIKAMKDIIRKDPG